MGLIKNLLFKYSEKYQKEHLLYIIAGYSTYSNLHKIPYKKRTKELCLKAYKSVQPSCYRTDVLNDIPSEYFEDKDFCKKLLEINAEDCLHKIPTNYLTKDILTEILQKQKSFYLIEKINDINLADEELFEISYKNSMGNTFSCYPKDKKTYEKCFEVASKYPKAIKHVPTPFIDKKLIMAWIKNVKSEDIYDLFDYIPKAYLDKDVYSEIVKIRPDFIKRVPQEFYEDVRLNYIEFAKQQESEKTAK